MAIKTYNTNADYNAAVKPTNESQVSMIKTSREIFVDGVNAVTTEPVAGDVLFLDENNKKVYLKGGDWIQKANIPEAWTHVGYVYSRRGNKVGIVDKNIVEGTLVGLARYSITAISQTEITLYFHFGASWSANTPVNITLQSTNINAANAQAISEAVAAKAVEVGDTAAWWAYLADADGNKVESDGTQILIQRENWTNFQTNGVSAVGCTAQYYFPYVLPSAPMAYWAGEIGFMNTGTGYINYSMYRSQLRLYGRTPSSQEPIGPQNATPVKPQSFEESEFCSDLRDTYKTYDVYLEKCYKIMPQKYGIFSNIDGITFTKNFANIVVPAKNGGTIPVFPLMHGSYNKTYHIEGLDVGDWHMIDINDCMYLLDDDVANKVSNSRTKMGTANIYVATLFAGCYYQYGYYSPAQWSANVHFGNVNAENSLSVTTLELD